MHASSCFVTLTYDDAHCPPTLQYSDFQGFLRRFRYRLGSVRYFCAGEYGGLTGRPHFHALLFGWSPSDLSPIGKDLGTSKVLQSLWDVGFSSVGSVTYESARYVASYACKSRSRAARLVDCDTGECGPRVPECAHMSLRPGLGATWYAKYWPEVHLARDAVVRPGGSALPAPRYYDKLCFRDHPSLFADKEYERWLRSQNLPEDGPSLQSREINAKARQALKVRAL